MSAGADLREEAAQLRIRAAVADVVADAVEQIEQFHADTQCPKCPCSECPAFAGFGPEPSCLFVRLEDVVKQFRKIRRGEESEHSPIIEVP